MTMTASLAPADNGRDVDEDDDNDNDDDDKGSSFLLKGKAVTRTVLLMKASRLRF